ncbi:hypothetical protein RND71_042429 [Anisodus tanguticus]|uniref:Bet v I/Major latex protein domain-containing protein n=1 Tax=Anisodus tanguticus TaxID=243964 RepID=A0AAE1UP46_9SOLA|nr:hypothetical protein RND71_042429 [Anisodus tanguticus]
MEVKCAGELFHDHFNSKPHHIPNISPDKIQNFDIHEGELGIVGSLVSWKITLDALYNLHVIHYMKIVSSGPIYNTTFGLLFSPSSMLYIEPLLAQFSRRKQMQNTEREVSTGESPIMLLLFWLTFDNRENSLISITPILIISKMYTCSSYIELVPGKNYSPRETREVYEFIYRENIIYNIKFEL